MVVLFGDKTWPELVANAIDPKPTLCLERGHYINAKFRIFPHLCPGQNCAILKWLSRKYEL